MSDEDTQSKPDESEGQENAPREGGPPSEQQPPPEQPPPERDDTAVEPDEASNKAEATPEPVEKKEPPKRKAPKKDAKTPAKKASEKLAEAGEGKRKTPPKKDEAKPKSADLVLAHRATAVATGGSVSKDGVLKVGERKFGAPVNANQFALVAAKVKGKNILQVLGCKEAELKGYADGSKAAKELPEQTRTVLKEMKASFDDRLKFWPRKIAAILYVLQQERKKGQRAASKTPAANAA